MDNPTEQPDAWPRVLFITPCAFNGLTGGGITFSNLFRGWPKDHLACVTSDTVPMSREVCEQYYLLGKHERQRRSPWNFIAPIRQVGGPLLVDCHNEIESLNSHQPSLDEQRDKRSAVEWYKKLPRSILGSAGIPEQGVLSSALKKWITNFKPDVIYTILGDTTMIDLVEQAAEAFDLPLVLHLMDEGVTEPQRTGWYGKRFNQHYGTGLKRLLARAADRLAICDAMADAYAHRYHLPFATFHNAVDVEAVMQRHLPANALRNTPPRLLYAGSLYPIAQDQSLLDCCAAVATLNAQGTPVELHVHAGRSLFGHYAQAINAFAGCSFYEALEDDAAFFEAITAADALVLPSNFDEASVRYIGLSMPTKVPAYLASGTPILVYGPPQTAQVRYFLDAKLGLIVHQKSPAELETAIKRLISDMPLREELSERAFALAQSQHHAPVVCQRFRDTLWRAVRT